MTAPLGGSGAYLATRPPWPAANRGNIANVSFDTGGFGRMVDSGVTGLPGNTAWALTNGANSGALGTNWYMHQSFAAGGSPNPAFLQFPTTPILYSSWWWRPSNPFNSNGVISFCDQVKVDRHLGANFGTQMGSLFVGIGSGSNGNWAFSWDQITGAPGNRTANTNTPAPTATSLMGTWIRIEVVTDLRVNNAIRFQCRINGVQYFDYTDALSNVDPGTGQPGVYGTYQNRGTINQNVPSTSGSSEDVDELFLDDFSRGFLASPTF